MGNLKQRFLDLLKEQEEDKELIINKGGVEEGDKYAAEPSKPDEIDPNAIDKIGLEDFSVKTKEEYWNELDPATGARYVIPYVNPLNPNYVNEYVYYMQIKHMNPKQFERIMNWE